MIGLSPLPQVIAAVFNRRAFGPPRGLTPASACPTGSFTRLRVCGADYSRPFRTRFRSGSLSSLTSPTRQRLAGSFYKRHAVTPYRVLRTACGRTVSGTVSLPARCFSPFPHGTCALSVTGEYSGLDGGPPSFGPGFTCPALLRDPAGPSVPGCAYGAVTLCRRPSHAVRAPLPGSAPGAPAPGREALQPRRRYRLAHARSPVWPSVPFRSPLLGKSMFNFSLLRYLDVSVPRVPSHRLCVHHGDMHTAVHGFSHSDIYGSKDVCCSPRLSQLTTSFIGSQCQRYPRLRPGI